MLTAKAVVNKSQLCGYHTLHPPPWEKLAHHITSFKITSFITLLDKPKSISIHELQPLNQHHFLYCILHTQIKRLKKFTNQEPHISDAISTLCAKPSKFYTILEENIFLCPWKRSETPEKIYNYFETLEMSDSQTTPVLKVNINTYKNFPTKTML